MQQITATSCERRAFVGLAAGQSFWGICEGPVNFPPTGKYEPMQHEYSLQHSPTWSDRILWKASRAATLKAYDAYDVDAFSSPHRPVFSLHEWRSRDSAALADATEEGHASPEPKAYKLGTSPLSANASGTSIASEFAAKYQRGGLQRAATDETSTLKIPPCT